MSLYRDILRRAWQFTARRPWLWFFGLFASLLFSAEEVDILINRYATVETFQDRINEVRSVVLDGTLGQVWQNVVGLFAQNPLTSILAVVALVLIAFVIIWIIIVAQAALISAAAWHRDGKNLDFTGSFSEGSRYFRPVFVINFSAKLAVYGIFLLLELPLAVAFVRTGSAAVGLAMSIVAFLVLIPLNLFVVFIARYAAAFVVLEGDDAHDAIRKGWKLFLMHWLASIEMAVILFAINLAVSFLLMALLAFLGIPLTYAGYYVTLLLSALLTALLAVFQITSWTFLFFDLRERKITAKLLRWFAKGSLSKAAR